MSAIAPMLVLAGVTLAAGPAIGRDRVTRDVEGYAAASCLVAQKSPSLKDQGDGWAANIVQRDAFDPALFGRLTQAVKTEMAKGGMATIVVESPPMTTKDLPVQYCAEIIDAPKVRTAIDAAIAAVRRQHKRR